MKFKMAATAGLSLTHDPMGKMFQNASLKPLGQLKPNCPGMIIGRSSIKFLFFMPNRKSKMATTAGHRLTLDPMGKCSTDFKELSPCSVWYHLKQYFSCISFIGGLDSVLLANEWLKC